MAGARLFLALWLTLCCALAQADVVRVRAFDDIIESGVLKVAMYENFPRTATSRTASRAASTSSSRRSLPKAWASSSKCCG